MYPTLLKADFFVIWSGTRTQKSNWIAYLPYLRNAL
jgi:hypothetical protein